MKTALVVGSTGLVGELLVKELVSSSSFDLVFAIVRKKHFNTKKKLKEIVFDFNNPKSFQTLEAVDHVFCCLGTTIKKAGSKESFRYVDFDLPLSFANWAEETQADTFSTVTALGADSSSKIFYNKVKGELENRLKEFNIPTIQIFQPSLILGKRKEFRIGELIGKAVFKCINPFLFGLLKKYRGIEAVLIARGMVSYLKNCSGGVNVIESHLIDKYEKESIQ